MLKISAFTLFFEFFSGFPLGIIVVTLEAVWNNKIGLDIQTTNTLVCVIVNGYLYKDFVTYEYCGATDKHLSYIHLKI